VEENVDVDEDGSILCIYIYIYTDTKSGTNGKWQLFFVCCKGNENSNLPLVCCKRKWKTEICFPSRKMMNGK
jgi:hypothetical protein